MKQFILGAAATGMLLASVLTGATSVAADPRCSGGFYLHNNISADPTVAAGYYNPDLWTVADGVFASKDANNNGYLCVRGSGPHPYSDPKAITVIDDRLPATSAARLAAGSRPSSSELMTRP
jgi:hypothetical protein